MNNETTLVGWLAHEVYHPKTVTETGMKINGQKVVMHWSYGSVIGTCFYEDIYGNEVEVSEVISYGKQPCTLGPHKCQGIVVKYLRKGKRGLLDDLHMWHF